jgi:altronate hydrolase
MSNVVSLIRRPTLRLNPADDVVIAARPLPAGSRVDAEGVTCAQAIPAGHKLAVRAVARGQRCDATTRSSASLPRHIAPGQSCARAQYRGQDLRSRLRASAPTSRPLAPAAAPATFMGIRRADGRVATRNYIWASISTGELLGHGVAGRSASSISRGPSALDRASPTSTAWSR